VTTRIAKTVLLSIDSKDHQQMMTKWDDSQWGDSRLEWNNFERHLQVVL